MKRGFWLALLVSTLPPAVEGTGVKGSLSPPQERKSLTLTPGEKQAQVQVYVKGWFRAPKIQEYRRKIQEHLDAVVRSKRYDRSPRQHKQALLRIAEELESRKDRDPVEFWEAEGGDWVWKFKPSVGRREERRVGYYSRKELSEYKKEALRWAERIKEEYADARK